MRRSTRKDQATGGCSDATAHENGPRQTARVTALPPDATPLVTDPYVAAAATASELVERLGAQRVAVVLGSGWAPVAELLGPVQASSPAAAFTGVPSPTVPGHRGVYHSVLAESTDGPVPVLVMAGRAHLYEGHSIETVVHPVRAAVLAGCSTVVLTNAAGSLRPQVGPGTPVLISDHLNLTGSNPMCGPLPPPDVPGRFVDLSDLYSARRREAIRAAAPDLSEGVYAGLLGASFETPAEIRMLATLGADLVGMSTVLEAIAARHLGAEVVGVSLVTNLAAGLQPTVDHEEVLSTGSQSAERLAGVLRTVLATL